MTARKFTPPTTFPAEYVTRKGDRAIILGTMPNDDYPYVGYVVDDGCAFHRSWTADGRHFISTKETFVDLFDIPREPKKQVHWANDYDHVPSGCWHASRELADTRAAPGRIAVIRREWPEGGKPEYFREDV